MKIDGNYFSLSLWDTAGQDAYDRLRPLSYPQTDVFLVCFSTADPNSFHNIRSKWYPEIYHHAPGVPIVLVGTKTDLREEEIIKEAKDPGRKRSTSRWGRPYITTEEGTKLAKDIRAASYQECSSLKLKGVVRVFHEAIYAGTTRVEKTTAKSRCRII